MFVASCADKRPLAIVCNSFLRFKDNSNFAMSAKLLSATPSTPLEGESEMTKHYRKLAIILLIGAGFALAQRRSSAQQNPPPNHPPPTRAQPSETRMQTGRQEDERVSQSPPGLRK